MIEARLGCPIREFFEREGEARFRDIEEEVIEQFDHKNLNLDTEEFRDLNPTAENIVWVIWQKLRARVPQEMNLSVRLYETPRNFVEFNG